MSSAVGETSASSATVVATKGALEDSQLTEAAARVGIFGFGGPSLQ